MCRSHKKSSYKNGERIAMICGSSNRSIFFALLIVTFIWWGCSGTSDEEKARAICQNAQRLREQNLLHEALQEYNRLKNYTDTKAYKQAQAALMKEGLSIGASIESWTIQQMYKIKDKLLREGQDSHPKGEVMVSLTVKDGWGTFFRVQYSTNPKYAFYVLSAGPDKTIKTSDDLRLYQTGAARQPHIASRPITKQQPSQVKESVVSLGELLRQ
jgi:hypothetical protein